MDEQAIRARVTELTEQIVPSARTEARHVWQRAPHALELDELESLALSGLASASARWVDYCAEKGHSPEAFEFFRAFVTRRMRGAMLDHLRSLDWVTRSARTKVKALREAGHDRGLTDAELAAATGMDVAEVRGALAAVAARPVSMDAEPHDIAAADDVEGAAVVSQVLTVMTGVITRLGDPYRVIMALKYYQGMTIPEISPYIGVSVDEAVRLHADAILACHAEMMRVIT
jgi:RNA polymerase sigma factor FliA